jgi:hypothetical protein
MGSCGPKARLLARTGHCASYAATPDTRFGNLRNGDVTPMIEALTAGSIRYGVISHTTPAPSVPPALVVP